MKKARKGKTVSMVREKREYFLEGIKYTNVAIKIEEQRKNLTQCMFDTDFPSEYSGNTTWRNVLVMEETRLGKLTVSSFYDDGLSHLREY